MCVCVCQLIGANIGQATIAVFCRGSTFVGHSSDIPRVLRFPPHSIFSLLDKLYIILYLCIDTLRTMP